MTLTDELAADPELDELMDILALGMLLGAGPPIDQLRLSPFEFGIHADVIARAAGFRRNEIELLSLREITWGR